MEYRAVVERINALLEEADEIEQMALSIQSDRPSSWSPEQSREFRKCYQDWYAAALLTLPDNMKSTFVKEYVGGTFQPGIQKFVSEPTKPNPLFARAALENPEAISSLYWLYPVETAFERRFVEQQALLRQARERHLMHSTIPEQPIPGVLGGLSREESSTQFESADNSQSSDKFVSEPAGWDTTLGEQASVSNGYIEIIAVILKDNFTLSTIDRFFQLADADPEWKVEPVTDYSQQRIRLALGWFQGIAQNAPDELVRITNRVVEQMIDHDELSDSNRRDLTTIRDRLQDKVVDQATGLANTGNKMQSEAGTTTVFISHGHNPTWAELILALQSRWNVEFEYFENRNHTAQQISEIIGHMTDRSSIAIIVMTAEDELADGSRRPRQNVIHEAGMCHAALGFDRVALLIEPAVEKFSNAQGLVYITYDPAHVNGCLHDLEGFLERLGAKRATNAG